MLHFLENLIRDLLGTFGKNIAPAALFDKSQFLKFTTANTCGVNSTL